MCRLANFWGTAALLERDGKRNFHSGGTEMLRKTLITLTAVAALGIGSTAMAALAVMAAAAVVVLVAVGTAAVSEVAVVLRAPVVLVAAVLWEAAGTAATLDQ
jgi:hypothetical protein